MDDFSPKRLEHAGRRPANLCEYQGICTSKETFLSYNPDCSSKIHIFFKFRLAVVIWISVESFFDSMQQTFYRRRYTGNSKARNKRMDFGVQLRIRRLKINGTRHGAEKVLIFADSIDFELE